MSWIRVGIIGIQAMGDYIVYVYYWDPGDESVWPAGSSTSRDAQRHTSQRGSCRRSDGLVSRLPRPPLCQGERQRSWRSDDCGRTRKRAASKWTYFSIFTTAFFLTLIVFSQFNTSHSARVLHFSAACARRPWCCFLALDILSYVKSVNFDATSL